MRPRLRCVCVIAVLLLALTVSARAGQGRQPPRASRPPSPIGLRAYAIVDVNAVAAKESFDAVLGTSQMTAFGGGLDVVDLWKHLFARVAITRARKSGRRVFVANNEVFPLGIPLTVTMTPVEAGAGWRFVSRKGSNRVIPYAGAAFLSMGYAETSMFAESADNTSERFAGQDLFGGVDIDLIKWLALSAEGQYRRVPNALGAGGVSKDFGESDLGGFSARVMFGIRTKR